MRRRSLLAALGTTVAGALAGCNGNDARTGEPRETATAVPIPTDPPAPDDAPPADLSPIGVADAAELGDAHWRTLSATPHGFTREATVLEDDEVIRRMAVTVRAAADAAAYHFTFDVEDTDRYPSRPLEPYVELWDDGTTYQRYGETDPSYAVTDGRSFDAASVRTTERYRVRTLFEAVSEASIDRTPAGHAVVGSGLRAGYDVTPRRLRLLESPRDARLAATVGTAPLFVATSELEVLAAVSNRPVDVTETVTYERFDEAPEPPDWVEAASDASS